MNAQAMKGGATVLPTYHRSAMVFRLSMLALDFAPDSISNEEEEALGREYREAERAWLATPAPDAGAVLDKLRHLWREMGEPSDDEKATIIADLYRLTAK